MLVRMLRLLCREFFSDDTPVSAAAVERFENMLLAEKSGICVLDEKRRLRFAGGMILPCVREPENVVWEWKKVERIRWGNWVFSVTFAEKMPDVHDLFTACFSADELPDELVVGVPQEGEKMVPFGKSHPVKIKELRIKRKVPPYPAIPVVREVPGNVLWLPGIRHSACYPVADGGACVIFSAKKIEDFN